MVPESTKLYENIEKVLQQSLTSETKEDLHKTERLLRDLHHDQQRLSNLDLYDEEMSDESIEHYIDRTFENEVKRGSKPVPV